MVENELEKETELWAKADNRRKSHLVQVLHWFHFRPSRLRGSWLQEEVLTWELLRALELLPQRFFLQPLLRRISRLSREAEAATRPLLAADRVQILPYPNLKLTAAKRNCKSDIGFGVADRQFLWIEAKTARFRAADLEAQLRQQANALAMQSNGFSTSVVTLLPSARALDSFPNLSWDDVLAQLLNCHRALSGIEDADFVAGYRLLAKEMADRIDSHPNRQTGWV